MTQSRKKIDSNVTNLAYAEETDLQTLPVAVLTSDDGTFAAGIGPALSMDLTIVDLLRTVNIDLSLDDIINAYVRLVHIRDSVAINLNAGTLILADPLASGLQVGTDPNALTRFFAFPAVLTAGAVSIDLDLSGVLVQDGDIFQIQVATQNGFLNSSTRSITWTVTGGPTWYQLEPNSYEDFGGEIKTVARNPIRASRQRRKGVVVDLDASGGFNTDVTQNGLTRLMQGFFFADAHEKISTGPFNGTGLTVDTISATQVTFEEDVSTIFKVNQLIYMKGFALTANNGFKRVTAVSGLTISVPGAIDATPDPDARLEICGIQLTAGEANLVVTGNSFTISSTAVDFTTLGFNVGEWIYIGGDDIATRFAVNSTGYARIKAIAAGLLQLELPTWDVENETGTGKTIQIFYGMFLRNEDQPALIKRRSYQLERTLGEDDSGTQCEYLVGAIANEFKLNIPSVDKLNCDLTFVAMTNDTRDGTEGQKTGPRVSPLGEDAFNTSSDIFQQSLYILSEVDLTPTNLFGYVLEGNLNINNNATGLKAVGVLGSFDINVGDFEVDGELNCYFAEVAAVQAVKDNSSVGYNLIAASTNQGFVYDLPLLTLGGGRVEIEKDNPVMLPLESMGAENPYGYTLSLTTFAYLPDVAMPVVQ